MHPLLGVLLSYLAGSVPFAYLAGKARGIDLRQHGSGNLGATNAVRVLGPRIGGLVYLAHPQIAAVSAPAKVCADAYLICGRSVRIEL